MILYLKIGDDIMALSKFKKMLVDEVDDDEEEEEIVESNSKNPLSTNNSGKMILLEPRSY